MSYYPTIDCNYSISKSFYTNYLLLQNGFYDVRLLVIEMLTHSCRKLFKANCDYFPVYSFVKSILDRSLKSSVTCTHTFQWVFNMLSSFSDLSSYGTWRTGRFVVILLVKSSVSSDVSARKADVKGCSTQHLKKTNEKLAKKKHIF